MTSEKQEKLALFAQHTDAQQSPNRQLQQVDFSFQIFLTRSQKEMNG